jgi:hypothetical protein
MVKSLPLVSIGPALEIRQYFGVFLVQKLEKVFTPEPQILATLCRVLMLHPRPIE